jgi:MFS family permease
MALLYLTVGTAIAEELNTDLFVWMLTASNIASGAIAPWVGPLADLIGRRAIFLWGGFGLSALAAIICAAAPNGEAFTAGQVIFGIGNVVQDLMSLAIVAESVPTSKRPMYTGESDPRKTEHARGSSTRPYPFDASCFEP